MTSHTLTLSVTVKAKTLEEAKKKIRKLARKEYISIEEIKQ